MKEFQFLIDRRGDTYVTSVKDEFYENAWKVVNRDHGGSQIFIQLIAIIDNTQMEVNPDGK